jgi:hypothetical protein
MPLKQYAANPNQETVEILKATANNLNNDFDFSTYTYLIEDTITKTNFFTSPAENLIWDNVQPRRQRAADFTLPADIISIGSQALVLRNQLILNTGDNATTIIGYDLRQNDTISSLTTLADFYAYDDGSAEYGAGINQRFGQVAVRYELHEKDTLTDIQIHLTKFEKDLIGQTFNLVIWKSLGTPENPTDSVIYKINVPIQYPKKRNEFLSIEKIKQLSDPNFRFKNLGLEGTFYVGWEQTTNDRMTVGYDRNTNSTDQIFFNAGNQWANWDAEADEFGSLMIRPVFGDNIVLGYKPDSRPQFTAFPNPATDQLNLQGELPKQIEILDLNGNAHFKANIPQGQSATSFRLPAHLASGIYLLKATTARQQIFHLRLIIR